MFRVDIQNEYVLKMESGSYIEVESSDEGGVS